MRLAKQPLSCYEVGYSVPYFLLMACVKMLLLFFPLLLIWEASSLASFLLSENKH